MFAMIARTQFAWTRHVLGGFAVIAFLMPALAWRLAGDNAGATGAAQLLDGFSALGPMLGFLSFLGPFVVAAYPWMVDAESNHVYPLSLPLRWERFVAMRYLAGALSLLIPVIALYLGARLALAFIVLPDLLQSYAGPVAVRFFLAALVSYSATFALQYLAGRNATRVALVLLVALGVLLVILGVTGQVRAANAIGTFLFEWPGPFAIFTDPWTLIDV